MITIREVEDKDLIPLAELLPRGFPDTTTEFWLQRFDMWWISNPAYTPQLPRGWVLDTGTTLVGFIGNIPVKFLIRGEVKIGAASSSWYVEPPFRGIISLRLFNKFMNQRHVSFFLFKAEEAPIMGILRKYKFEEYILPQSQTEYIYILNKKKVGFVLRKILFSLRYPKLAELPEFFKRLGMVTGAYIYQKPIQLRNVLPQEMYTTSLCTACDDTFSKIWLPYQNRCDVSLFRDTKTLNWHYFSSGRFHKRLVIQCHRARDKTLAGYMVFDFERHIPSGGVKMRLMDICIADKDPQVIASLTSGALEIGKQNNADFMTMWADSPQTDAYFRNTFVIRRHDMHYRFIRFSDSAVMNSEKDHHGTVCLPMIYPPQ
ncbi:MAG: hypothetical protein LUQ04_02695 [Methanoregula sp.]|nr:hypothetical protein [Methanoregula sp.]